MSECAEHVLLCVLQHLSSLCMQTREILLAYVRKTLGTSPSGAASNIAAINSHPPRTASPALQGTSPAHSIGSQHDANPTQVTSLPPDDLSHLVSSAALWGSNRQAVQVSVYVHISVEVGQYESGTRPWPLSMHSICLRLTCYVDWFVLPYVP